MFLKKKIIQPKGMGEVRVGSYPIYTQHCKHTRLYYMCFSLVFACLSVSRSVGLGAGSQEPCSATHPTYASLPHPGNRTWDRYGPQSWWGRGRAWASASTLAPEACVCAWACMYMGTCVQVCTRGRVTSQRRQAGLLEARPAWVAGSQVDSPQVSGCCDGVALRA